MALLESAVAKDEVFDRRQERMDGLVAELRERTAQIARGGGDKSVERHRSRGKLTARERIDSLVDPDGNAIYLWEVIEGLKTSNAPAQETTA
jgi:3-methylcrotonyl-CoA carboxylase beta subunit